MTMSDGSNEVYSISYSRRQHPQRNPTYVAARTDATVIVRLDPLCLMQILDRKMPHRSYLLQLYGYGYIVDRYG